MASLTHVCMLMDNDWKPISAEKAAKIHPGGTVSAQSGLFMCELCGQYVTLVDGDKMVRHFRHSAYEKSKDCPERTFGAGYTPAYNASEHDLPLRIVNVTSSDFRFELGFVRIPNELFTSDLKIEINGSDLRSERYKFNAERLNPDKITYLDVGGTPRKQYQIRISGTDRNIYQFWPTMVSGVDPAGTVFEQASGCKLATDADVEIGKKYYIISCLPIRQRNKHITINEISKKNVSGMTWRVYEIEALDYNEMSARFFLEYHCRLSEHPVEIHPIWPVTVKSPYVLKHLDEHLTLYIKGRATAHVFPETKIVSFPKRHGNVIDVRCDGRQQLISAGRANVLQYTYFWKDPLEYRIDPPKIDVTTFSGEAVESGVSDKLPPDRCLRITSELDGFIVLCVDKVPIERRRLQANTSVLIDNLRYGMEIEAYVGCDCVWSLFIKRADLNKNRDEAKLLKQLTASRGAMVPAPHTLGSMSHSLAKYPLIRKWLYECIRKGEMPAGAYRKLKSFIIDNSRYKENE